MMRVPDRDLTRGTGEAKPKRELYVRLYSSGTHQQMQKHLQSEDVILPYRAAVLMAVDRPR
jgi:hypothetical protein